MPLQNVGSSHSCLLVLLLFPRARPNSVLFLITVCFATLTEKQAWHSPAFWCCCEAQWGAKAVLGHLSLQTFAWAAPPGTVFQLRRGDSGSVSSCSVC